MEAQAQCLCDWRGTLPQWKARVVSVAEGLPDGRDAGSRRKQDLLTLSLCSSQALRRYL